MAGILKGGAQNPIEVLGRFVRPYYKKIGKSILPLMKNYAQDLIRAGGAILTAEDLQNANHIKGSENNPELPLLKKAKKNHVPDSLLVNGENFGNNNQKTVKKVNRQLGNKARSTSKAKKKIKVASIDGGKKKKKVVGGVKGKKAKVKGAAAKKQGGKNKGKIAAKKGGKKGKTSRKGGKKAKTAARKGGKKGKKKEKFSAESTIFD